MTEPDVIPNFLSFMHQVGYWEVGEVQYDYVALVRIGDSIVELLLPNGDGGEMADLEQIVAIQLGLTEEFTPEEAAVKLIAYQKLRSTPTKYGPTGLALEFDLGGRHISEKG